MRSLYKVFLLLMISAAPKVGLSQLVGVPTIKSISPSSVSAGSSGFLLQVAGTGFIDPTLLGSPLPPSVVLWNNTRLKTFSVSNTELAAEVPAVLIARPGSAIITVFNVGDYVSNAVTLRITDGPAPPAQSIPDVEQGVTKSGYVIVTPNGSSLAPLAVAVLGVVRNAAVLAQALVFPAVMTTDAVQSVEVLPAVSRNVGVAIANPEGRINLVTLTLRDETGLTLGTPLTITLQPRQQLTRFISELFDSTIIGTGFRGTVRIQSSIPFALLGLRFSGSAFSTSPSGGNSAGTGVPSMTLTAGAMANTPLAGTVGGIAATIFPQFAMFGGWATQISVINVSDTTISGRIDLFDASGSPMAVTLNGRTQSTFSYSIPPAGTIVIGPRDVNGLSPF
jgi:hypothetical protein